jgi:hypothetical protein
MVNGNDGYVLRCSWVDGTKYIALYLSLPTLASLLVVVVVVVLYPLPCHHTFAFGGDVSPLFRTVCRHEFSSHPLRFRGG